MLVSAQSCVRSYDLENPSAFALTFKERTSRVLKILRIIRILRILKQAKLVM
jgi:hypothetical protein